MAIWALDREDGLYLIECPSCSSFELAPMDDDAQNWKCVGCDRSFKIHPDANAVSLTDTHDVQRVLNGPDIGHKHSLVGYGENGEVTLPKPLCRDLDPTGLYGNGFSPYEIVARAQRPSHIPKDVWDGALKAFLTGWRAGNDLRRAWDVVTVFLKQTKANLGMDQEGELYMALKNAVESGRVARHVRAFARTFIA